MYDNHIGRGVFNSYQDMIEELMEGNSNIELEDLSEKIYKSYQDGKLSGTQYDYLTNLIEEYR